MCAAGGLPGELHKLWTARTAGSYHLEYGYSCMGYEIAGGLGVKMADPSRTVVVMVGDGSYLMMNSEIATSVMLGLPLVIVVLDNRGFGCINRLQQATGGGAVQQPARDHRSTRRCRRSISPRTPRSLGAHRARSPPSPNSRRRSPRRARPPARRCWSSTPTAAKSTADGGHWWDVAVPEVSERGEVTAARRAYETAMRGQRIGE